MNKTYKIFGFDQKSEIEKIQGNQEKAFGKLKKLLNNQNAISDRSENTNQKDLSILIASEKSLGRNHFVFARITTNQENQKELNFYDSKNRPIETYLSKECIQYFKDSNINILYKHSLQQKDSWSCGYMSFLNSLDNVLINNNDADTKAIDSNNQEENKTAIDLTAALPRVVNTKSSNSINKPNDHSFLTEVILAFLSILNIINLNREYEGENTKDTKFPEEHKRIINFVSIFNEIAANQKFLEWIESEAKKVKNDANINQADLKDQLIKYINENITNTEKNHAEEISKIYHDFIKKINVTDNFSQTLDIDLDQYLDPNKEVALKDHLKAQRNQVDEEGFNFV